MVEDVRRKKRRAGNLDKLYLWHLVGCRLASQRPISCCVHLVYESLTPRVPRGFPDLDVTAGLSECVKQQNL